MDDIHYIDPCLPAELCNLPTSELLDELSIANYPIIFTNSDNEAFGQVVGNGIEYQNMEEPAELPNSTVTHTPPATCTHPCTEDFAGTFGFDICYDALIGPAGSSNSWAFSEAIRTVFIKMSNVLMIQFKTSTPLGHNTQFFIRALLVYQNNDFVNQPVCRCSIHAMEDDPGQRSHTVSGLCNCDQYNMAGHVLRCHTEGAIYQYDANSERHSVLVAIPRAPLAGSHFLKAVHYFFTCKTSCPRGMQRRAVQMIFTLEDEKHQVYGRKVLPVKICSCPKRDKDRQEKDMKPVDDTLERKAQKRPRRMTENEDVKPTKVEIDHHLFMRQIRQATRESLNMYLKDLVEKQAKDLSDLKEQTSELRQLNAKMAALNTKMTETTVEIADLQAAVETTEKTMELRQNEINEIAQRL